MGGPHRGSGVAGLPRRIAPLNRDRRIVSRMPLPPEGAASPEAPVRIAGFYRFRPIADPQGLATELRRVLAGLRGTVLLAGEGINGVLAGAPGRIAPALEHLDRLGLMDRHLRFSSAHAAPFERLAVRVRAEIVTFDAGVTVSPERARYVDAAGFEALLRDPAVRVIDTRNRYEVGAGRFRGAEDPGIQTFRDFRSYVERALDPGRDRRVALYCTGGIRCEKAAAWMREQGFADVAQLDGGILSFLAERPDSDAWEGDCFVFDRRIAVDRYGAEAGWVMCHGCRAPLSVEARRDLRYEAGVSCPHCADGLSAQRRARLRARAAARQRDQHRTAPAAEPRGGQVASPGLSSVTGASRPPAR